MHLTIAISESNSGDIGVSATKEGVEECFCGVGSSSRRRTVGFGFGSGSVRRFLEWTGNGVEGSSSSSSSERMMGSIATAISHCWFPSSSNKRGIRVGTFVHKDMISYPDSHQAPLRFTLFGGGCY